jgi:hypothetical protein
MFNESGRAKNAIRNLDGNVIFEGKNAKVCGGYKFTIGDDILDHMQVSLNRAGMGNTPIYKSYPVCSEASKNDADLVVVERKSLLNLSSDKIGAFFDGVNSIPLSHVFSFNYTEHQAMMEQRNADSQKNKENISSGKKDGFGLLSLSGSGNAVCTTEKSIRVVEEVLLRLKKNSPIALKSLPTEGFITESINEIFIHSKKKKCGFIFSDVNSLKKLVNAMERDRISFSVHHEWITSESITGGDASKVETPKENSPSNSKDAVSSEDSPDSAAPASTDPLIDGKSAKKKLEVREKELEEREKELMEKEKELKVLKQRSKTEQW